MNPELHQRQRVKAGANIIEHDPPAAGQFFQQPQRWRFENIESSKKYKTGKSILPSQRNRNKGDPLADNFVNNDEVGVGLAALAFYRRRGGDAHQEPAQTQKQKPGPAHPPETPTVPIPRPDKYRDGRCPGSRPGPQISNSVKGCEKPVGIPPLGTPREVRGVSAGAGHESDSSSAAGWFSSASGSVTGV